MRGDGGLGLRNASAIKNHRPGRADSAAGLPQTGRIAIMARSGRLNSNADRSRICFNGRYLRLISAMPRANSSPVTISARAPIHGPVTFPHASHGAILLAPLLRMRFTLPESAVV